MQSITDHVIIICNTFSAPELDFGGTLKGKRRKKEQIQLCPQL